MSGEELLERDDPTGLVRNALADDEAARAYLRRAWLGSAVNCLRDVRRRSGKTQLEVAEALGTTKSAIARLEGDRAGRFTVRRFIEYALACDAMPLDISVDSFARVREYIAAFPEASRDSYSYTRWKRSRDWTSWRLNMSTRVASSRDFSTVIQRVGGTLARPKGKERFDDDAVAATYQRSTAATKPVDGNDGEAKDSMSRQFGVAA